MRIKTPETVGDALGITPQRVRQILRELGIEPQRIGKAIVLSDSDVLKIERRNTQRGPRKKGGKK